MKKRRLLTGIFLIIYALTLTGCGYEAFQRKFVRKKKKGQAPPAIYHVEPFVKPPNSEIYSHAFLFWKTWENELLTALSPAGYPRTINSLKVKECLEQSVSSLREMKNCLNQNKAEELQPYVRELEQFNALLEKQEPSDAYLARMRHDIESHKRNVDIRFCLSAIKNDIRNDSSRAESE